jgi:hypothetical protein
MSTKDRYIVKRVDGFVCVCDTQDNEAPVDNGAVGLATLLNALNNANATLKAENNYLRQDRSNLLKLGNRMREMVGDHYLTLVWDYETGFKGGQP